MKQELRTRFKQIRREISPARREEAEAAAVKDLLEKTRLYTNVLSYASFCTEFSTLCLNNKLAEQGRLLLPAVSDQELHVYTVSDLDQLVPSSLGVPEPDPQRHKRIPADQVSVALVPAIAFDKARHRLGYGKGFYDRFLSKYPHIHTIGIGFTEQRSKDPLPSDHSDHPLDEILLY